MGTTRRTCCSSWDTVPRRKLEAPHWYPYMTVKTPPPLEAYADKIMVLFAPTLFQQVMTASKTYVERFGGELDEDGALMKFGEEVSEFYENATQDTPIRNDHEANARKRHMAEEAIDVMVTMGGVMACYGLTFADIEQAAREKLAKLDARTTDDYAWNGKTVERIGKKVQS